MKREETRDPASPTSFETASSEYMERGGKENIFFPIVIRRTDSSPQSNYFVSCEKAPIFTKKKIGGGGVTLM